MKTATIRIYTPWGARYPVADLLYRGALMRTFTQQDVLDWTLPAKRSLREVAKAYAEARGFTHFKEAV